MSSKSTRNEEDAEVEPVSVGQIRQLRRELQSVHEAIAAIGPVSDEIRAQIDESRAQLDESRELMAEVRARMAARSA